MFGSAKRKDKVVELKAEAAKLEQTHNFSDDIDVELAQGCSALLI